MTTPRWYRIDIRTSTARDQDGKLAVDQASANAVGNDVRAALYRLIAERGEEVVGMAQGDYRGNKYPETFYVRAKEYEITFTAPKALSDLIDQMSDQLKTDLTGTINKAFGSLKAILEARAEGKHVGVALSADVLETEFVP